MLDLLGSLVDKSLVVMEPRGGEARYRFLETMRQYAEEKLRLAGEADEVRRRHAAWYLALAEQAAAPSSVDRAGRALDRHGWCERLDLEHDNFRAALTWADRTADAALGLRLVGALHAFWSSFGEFWFQRADPEGRGWLDRFLAMHAERVPPRVRAKALRARAQLAVKEPADLERSDRCAAEALAICRSLDDRALLIDALHTQAMLKSWRDRHAEVIPFAREANALSREAGDPSRLLIGLARLGSALHETGDAAGAGAIVAEGAGLVAGLGPSVAVNLLDRLSGHVALARGDPAAAAAAFERSLAWNRSVGTQAGVWINLANLGAVALALGDGRRAAALFGQSLSELDYPRNGRASMVRCLLGLAAAASQPSTAARLLGAADGNWPASWGGPTADPEPRDRQLVDRVKAQLDASAFEAAWAEGRAMSAEQAIAFALEVAAELAASAPVDDQIERRPRG